MKDSRAFIVGVIGVIVLVAVCQLTSCAFQDPNACISNAVLIRLDNLEKRIKAIEDQHKQESEELEKILENFKVE